jgi:hypothetical protein
MWAVAMLVYWGLRDLSADASLVGSQVIAWSALAGLALLLALGRGARGLGERLDFARWLSVAAPLTFMVASLFLAWLSQGTGFGALGSLASGLRCFALGMLVAVPMVAVLAWSVRRSFPTGARSRGAVLGAACGVGAAVVLTLHCASPFGGHVALAHGLPILLATVLGALAGEAWGRA